MPLWVSPRQSRPKENQMPANKRQTSSKAATAASKVLSGSKFSKTAKTAAASALSQTPKRKSK